MLRRLEGDLHVLVIRDPYGHLGLPKGHLEEGESEADAALREVREETGLTRLELGPRLGQIDWTFRQDGWKVHKHCTFFLMTSSRGAVRPEVEEGIRECLWMPLDEGARRVTYDNAREMVREAARRVTNGVELPFDL